MNNGLKADILNLIKSRFFKMHPLLKSHILFYSNGLAISVFLAMKKVGVRRYEDSDYKTGDIVVRMECALKQHIFQ